MRVPDLMGELPHIDLLAAFDVDGTVIDETGMLTPGADLLAALRSAGAFVGLCTARPSWGVAKIVADIGGVDFVSALQGADITVQGRRALGEGPALPSEVVAECVERAGSADVWLFTREGWYVTSSSPAAEVEASILGRPWDGLLDQAAASVLKVTVIADDFHDQFGDCGGEFRVSLSKARYWEIVSNGCEEEKGLRLLSRVIRPMRTVAFGDGANDIAMLRFADRGFTFWDAPAAVRAAATDIMEPVRKHRDMRLAIARLVESGSSGIHVGR